MKVLGAKLGFVETFLFCHRFLFHFSSFFLLFYVNVTALNRSAMWPITVCCKLPDSEGTSLLACEQGARAGEGEGGGVKTNSVSESKNSASEADGEGEAGVPVDIAFDAPFRSLVINLLQIN